MAQERAIKVTLVRSIIGYTQDQRATVRALGLHRTHSSAYHWETPQIRGMVNKISHLLKVEEISPEELETLIREAEETEARAKAQADSPAKKDES